MSQNMDFGGSGGEMPGLANDPGKKRGIDDIIEHMTADLHYEGQYIVLGSHQAGGSHHPVWPNTTQPPPNVYYHHRQPVRENNDLMMMDMGGGKYVNVVFSKTPASQEYNQPMGFIRYQQTPPNIVQPHIIDYAQRGYNENMANGGCLIENVVGNWVPNRNGTYSPFGTVPQEEPPIAAPTSAPPIAPVQSPAAPARKQRIVAEVKPMRPSYSDVLAKSPPLTPPPTTKQTTKQASSAVGTPAPKQEGSSKKQQSKPNSLSGGKTTSNLKRENSNGSNEALTEKARAAIRRWLSQEFEPPTKQPPEVKKERKKRSKTHKPVSEKEEKLENSPLSSNLTNSGSKENLEQSKVGPRKERSDSVGGVSSRAPTVTATATATVTERVLSSSKPKNRDRDERKGSSSKTERPTNVRNTNKSKRSQRSYRKRDSNLGALCRKWQEQSSFYIVLLTRWLINLLWDVTAMSASLLVHMCREVMYRCGTWCQRARSRLSWSGLWSRWWRPRDHPRHPRPGSSSSSGRKGGGGGGSRGSGTEGTTPPIPGSLQHNISLPVTGEEAMKRLLSCKGKDPYSILGVTSSCTDEEIKKYYKSQALLVHPDKNSQPGAEEAFKILVHAFDLIAEPEKRAAYDRYVAETNQVEQAWSELSDLLSQLHEKMEYAANTIRCNNCGKRHKRELTDRPSYAARYCAQCKIHHSVKEGDMWAESRGWWSCRYYACMEGSVYDITQWAHCQGSSVQRVKPDSHNVQYRVLMGRAPSGGPANSPGGGGVGPQAGQASHTASSTTPTPGGGPSSNTQQVPEPDFEDLLNTLYSHNGNGRGKRRGARKK